MTTQSIGIRHGTTNYDIDVDVSAPVSAFKAQIAAVTGVPPERQQILGVRGGKLKDDAVLSQVLLPGKKLMLIGTAEGAAPAPAPPAAPVQFLEEMPEEELAKLVEPSGLTNLGNTCFMAAAVQALRYIPPFRAAITGAPRQSFAGALLRVLNQLDSTPDAVNPVSLIPHLAAAMPAFKLGEQQDAEEFWTAALAACSTEAGNEVDQVFGFDLLTEVRPLTLPDDTKTADDKDAAAAAAAAADASWERRAPARMRSLPIHLSAPAQAGKFPTSLGQALREQYGVSGIGHVESNGTTMEQRVLLGSLPEYLCVQYVRFDWNETAKRRLKIQRRLEFPTVLDVADAVTPELKAAVQPVREYMRALEDAETDAVRDEDPAAARARLAAADRAAQIGTAMAAVSEAAAVAAAAATAAKIGERPARLDQPGAPGGYYGLHAVICHQGRADSGHYLSWVSIKGKWVKFDDTDVTVDVKESDVLNLAGGADGPSAYLLVYRAHSEDGAAFGPHGALRSTLQKAASSDASAMPVDH